jgi:hypothetical protein
VYEPDGTLLTGSLMHYPLPRATDMPPLQIVEQYTPSPLNPLGVKGVGEAGVIIGTAPIMNAVVDALAPLGITHLDMPYTAERVWAAIQGARPHPDPLPGGEGEDWPSPPIPGGEGPPGPPILGGEGEPRAGRQGSA